MDTVNLNIDAPVIKEVTVYHYGYIGNLYAGSEIVRLPEGLGIPANSTEIEPPAAGENEVARWTGAAWEIVPDHRGTVIYETATGKAAIMNDAGDVPDGFTTVEPPQVLRQYYKWDGAAWVADTGKKQEALAVLVSRFNAVTEKLIVGSQIEYTNASGSITITCDTVTQQNFTALYIMRGNQVYPYQVWEKNTSLNLADASEVEALCMMIMLKVETIRRERKAIRDTFSEMTTAAILETLAAIS